jgi:hypothetical protein
MPKSYSPEYVEMLNAVVMPDNLGVVLAKACVKANIPLKLVAKLFGVSRMTVHSWFRGGEIRSGRKQLIVAFLKVIEEDTARGVLPLADFKAAKEYIYELTSKEPA